MTRRSPFKYSNTTPEIIRLAVMMYIRFPVTAGPPDHQGRGFWLNRLVPTFAAGA